MDREDRVELERWIQLPRCLLGGKLISLNTIWKQRTWRDKDHGNKSMMLLVLVN